MKNAMAGVFLGETHENHFCIVCGASACILIRPRGWYTIRENKPGTWYCTQHDPHRQIWSLAEELLSGLSD